MRYALLHKEIGQTPLQAIEAWRRLNPRHAEMSACYAGRLDPMAEGKLLVLLGDECKRQKAYHGLDKEYEIEVLLDLATDTGDVLGMPSYAHKETLPSPKEMKGAVSPQIGTRTVPYPAFSSKTVNGKPLFAYALEGVLSSIAIPTHPETIYRIKHLRTDRVMRDTLETRIADILSHAPRSAQPSKELGADFRQDAIRAAWSSVFKEMPEREFCILTLRVTCGSGTYMRTLAERIGADLGTRGLALSIKRTRIGRYICFGYWIQEYR